jgi:hypothetical protein
VTPPSQAEQQARAESQLRRQVSDLTLEVKNAEKRLETKVERLEVGCSVVPQSILGNNITISSVCCHYMAYQRN